MTTLTEVYCDWFEALAPEVARELAVLLMRLYPGGLLEPALATPDVTDGFAPRLRRIGAGPAHRDAGHALTLAALTDFIFAERGRAEQWAADRERLEVLDEAREALGDQVSQEIEEWVNETRLRYPLRAKLWSKAGESWGRVRQGGLSETEIRAALRRLWLHN